MAPLMRKIRNEDALSFHSCLDAVAAERRYLGDVKAPPPEAVRGFVAQNIQDDIPQWVLVEDGQIIGWCDIRTKPCAGFEHVGILGMGLLKSYRGQGFGKQLLDKCIEEAKSQGRKRIELEVFASNTPAVELYRKYGFETEGRQVRARFLDDIWDDVLMMALWFEDAAD